MEYVRFGSSGLKVSKVILGCMGFGSPEWQPWVLDKDAALPILKTAFDAGITTWDTAGVYSNGESEAAIADAIAKYDLPREQLVVMTKCFAAVGPTPGTMTFGHDPHDRFYVNHEGLSRASIFNAVEASLKRLRTTYIDVLQIHRCDKEVSKEETMKALHDLVQSGKVRYIGASSMWTWEFCEYQRVAEKHGWTKFVSMQNQLSLLYREEEREMIPYCKETGIAVIPWSPLAGGRLARPLKNIEDTTRGATLKDHPMSSVISGADAEIIHRTEQVAKQKGWTMGQVAFVWAASKTTAPIVGASKSERIHEFVECSSWSLTGEEIEFLTAPYIPVTVRGHQ